MEYEYGTWDVGYGVWEHVVLPPCFPCPLVPLPPLVLTIRLSPGSWLLAPDSLISDKILQFLISQQIQVLLQAITVSTFAQIGLY
jgi:hypothetical protein